MHELSRLTGRGGDGIPVRRTACAEAPGQGEELRVAWGDQGRVVEGQGGAPGWWVGKGRATRGPSGPSSLLRSSLGFGHCGRCFIIHFSPMPLQSCF